MGSNVTNVNHVEFSLHGSIKESHNPIDLFGLGNGFF